MSKKLFTLIYGDSVHTSPKTKILPANEFSKLVDAEGVFQKIKEDAEKYRQEVILECEKLKEKAQEDGFNVGFSKWAEHVANLEAEIQRVRTETSKLVIPVALKAAKKIVGREIELKEDTIVDIVENNLKAVAQHKRITIYVNRKDLAIVEANRNRLKGIFESLESLSIREGSEVNPGGCIIETEGGIINAQIDQLWLALENAFSVLIKAQEKKEMQNKAKDEK